MCGRGITACAGSVARPVAGFAAGFGQQAHAVDDHAAVDCLAHVVYGQQRDLNAVQRLHFDAGLAAGFRGHATFDRAVGFIYLEVDRNMRQRQRMAHGHKKGDVLGVARVAGIMATKRTAELVPMCHPLALTHVSIDFELDKAASAIECRVTAETRGQTGVEMEALTGVQVALLTIYDMCKAVDRGMVIDAVRLLAKSGGKSGDWSRD